MSRLEILNSGSLRLDGRRPHELRSLALHITPENAHSNEFSSFNSGTNPKSDGSARVEQGLTVVHASVYGPREAKQRSNTLHDRAVIQCEVTIEPWSGRDRRKRSRADRRIAEICSALESTFEPVVQTHLYPRSTIDIFVSIERQDGGVLPCAINAVTLALLDAGISMSDYVVALSVGLHLQSGKTLLDLSSHEETALPHLITATLPRSGKITLAQLETRIHANVVQEMLAVVGQACSVLHSEMDIAMQERTKKLADALGGGGLGNRNNEAALTQQLLDSVQEDIEDDADHSMNM
ncbi:hypothetical protein L7F22_019638 [Adiantum nelumboides]|nr:hypothetical protein [Adiantum nelumboides]